MKVLKLPKLKDVHLNSEQYKVIWQQQKGIGKNSSSQSKKELVYFYLTKFEDYNNLRRVSQKSLRTISPIRNQDTVYISFVFALNRRLYIIIIFFWRWGLLEPHSLQDLS